ncbi:MAG: phospholipase [Gemmatimonadota bacterium]|jgi:predicted esterase|nr:phospholipase [Gemmatimonadota bacterium]
MSAPDPLAAAREHRLTVPRSARYYTLGGGGEVRELWVVLHGFGQLAGKFIRDFAAAASDQRLVVAPEALSRYYTDHASRKVGATWMTSEDRRAEIADYVRYLDLVVDELRATLAPRAERLEVHAFSQGTATACRWVALGRHQPERLVLWGGGVPPDLDLAAHGARLSRAGLTMVIGDRDEFISEEAVADQSARLEAEGVSFELQRFGGGHVVSRPVLAAMVGPPASGSI